MIDIKDMETSHIQNSIGMMARTAESTQLSGQAMFGKVYTEMVKELVSRYTVKQQDLEALPWSKKIRAHQEKKAARAKRKFTFEE